MVESKPLLCGTQFLRVPMKSNLTSSVSVSKKPLPSAYHDVRGLHRADWEACLRVPAQRIYQHPEWYTQVHCLLPTSLLREFIHSTLQITESRVQSTNPGRGLTWDDHDLELERTHQTGSGILLFWAHPHKGLQHFSLPCLLSCHAWGCSHHVTVWSIQSDSTGLTVWVGCGCRTTEMSGLTCEQLILEKDTLCLTVQCKYLALKSQSS